MGIYIRSSPPDAELFFELFKEAYPNICAVYDISIRTVAVHIELFPSYERIYMPRRLASAFVAICRKRGKNLDYKLVPSKNLCFIGFDPEVLQ